MSFDAMIEAATAAFKQNLDAFCQTTPVTRLTPEAAETVAAGLTQALGAAGVAGYRAFLEAFETPAPVMEVGGQRFRFKHVSPKEFLTPFGPMVLARRLYQNAGDTESHVPLDAAWGMEGHYMAPAVREAVLYACAHLTPEETAAVLGKCGLCHPQPTAIKHALEQVGAALREHKEALDARLRAAERAPQETVTLVGSLDGTTVLLNEPGVKRGRRPRETREAPEAKPSSTSWRNAVVGTVSFYAAREAPDKPALRLQTRYVARMPEADSPTVKAHFEAELAAAELQAGPRVDKVLILDGAVALWHYVEHAPAFEGYAKIVDYWHAAEHLAGAADALFGKGTPEARAWYERYATALLERDDGARRVQRSIRYYLIHGRLSKAAREAVADELRYFSRNGSRMRYAEFRRRGWPIGSGPVEAACKSVVKARLCRSGMRWSRVGGQRILDLRTYVKSQRWDAAWNEIKLLPRAA